jgi:hypothetical protein
MRVVKISTTAYSEEDFFLLTTLDDASLVEVINPLVMAERDGYEEYDNDSLVSALRKRYPFDKIEMYTGFDNLIF